MIGVSQQIITLDGRKIEDSVEVTLQSQYAPVGINPYLIPSVASSLEVQKENFIALNGREAFTGSVIIQADKGIDFSLLWPVLYSAANVGYTDVSFAVIAPRR